MTVQAFETLDDWCGRRESNPMGLDYQAFEAQCVVWHQKHGGVAIDAQIVAVRIALGVLARAELFGGHKPDVPDCGSSSGPSPQGACLDESGSRGEVAS